jgi:predicted Zn-dependent peptidase
VPDRDLPLVSINITVHTGKYLEPEGREGLAELTGYLLIHGGTRNRTAEEIEERLAFLAAQASSGIGNFEGNVGINLLSKDLDEGLQILREVLTEPRFQDDKIALRKKQMLQAMKQRNDESEAIESREYMNLAFGENFWMNKYSTKASVDAITRADIEEFHKKWFDPRAFVVSASGDFDATEMQAKLEKLFGNWPFKDQQPVPEMPKGPELAAPGVYIVDKDVNQGRVSILLPGIKREDPDYFAIQVMNDILGGGGFTSHIMNSVRSDEGLAYSAYSIFQGGTYYSSPFAAAYQSKSRTVTYAAKIVLAELQKMTEKPPTDQELNTSKDGYIQRFPQKFATKSQVAAAFASEEYTGRYATDSKYFQNYRAKIQAVTADDVQRVAKKYLTPEKSVILIVGDKKEISQKMPEHPVELKDITPGPINDVPLRDPLTMKPMTAKEKTATVQ